MSNEVCRKQNIFKPAVWYIDDCYCTLLIYLSNCATNFIFYSRTEVILHREEKNKDLKNLCPQNGLKYERFFYLEKTKHCANFRHILPLSLTKEQIYIYILI